MTGAEIGIINLSDVPLTVDNRALSYWAEGRWLPCLEDGQWQDSGWGVDLEAGAAVTGGVAIGCPPESVTGLRYEDLVVYQAGAYSVPSRPLSNPTLSGPADVAFTATSSGGCVLVRWRGGQEARRIASAGRPWVGLKATDQLAWIGCRKVESQSTTASASVPPGVWRVGESVSPGQYQLPRSQTASDCLTQIQQGDVFGPVTEQPTERMDLNTGQIVGTDCSWNGPTWPGPDQD